MAYNNKFYLDDYVREFEIGELMNKKTNNKAWINAVNIVGETPVHIAARRRILELFEFMLPYYNDIEACDNQGNTILHRLVDSDVESDEEHKQKRIDLVRTIISKGMDANRKNKHGSTPVHFAAKHHHIEILNILKEAKADFSLRTNDGETPLLLACKNIFKLRGTPDETNIIDFLIGNHNCDVNAADYEGYTALHYAIERCSSKIVIKLLEDGADVHCRTREHKLTPLHLAARRKYPTKMDILIKAGATVTPEDNDELTPLHLALLESTTETVERLVNYGADLNYPDAILQFTPLHLCVYQQRDDLFQLLTNAGADVNCSGEDGLTPLHLSSMLGNAEFAKILIDLGADVNCCDKNHSTPLHMAIRKMNTDVNGFDGSRSITYGKKGCLIVKLLTTKHFPTNENYEAVVRLLIGNGADVNAVTKLGKNLMYMAVEANNVNLMKILLDFGVEVNYKTSVSTFTPLHLAIHNSFTDAAELLINARADVNALTKDGKNCLYLAVESNCQEILALLIEQGVDLNCRENHSGFSPIHLALSKNNENSAKMLINAGADVNLKTFDDKSSMHMALESNCTEIVKVLMGLGAKLNCKGKRCLYTLLYIISEDYDINIVDKLDNFEKTPLLLAIDRLENVEIKKAILCLCALVNAGNNNECMSINYHITHNFMYNLKCLLTVGFDINDCNAFYKLVFGCVRGDGLIPMDSYCQTTKPLSDDCCTKIPNELFALIAHFRSQGNEYSHEVELLKKYSICNNLTLYDLLITKFKIRRLYVNHLNFCEIESKFPIYYELILARFREATIRGALLETTQVALGRLTSIDLSIPCIEEIVSNLEIIDVIAIIEAAEFVF